ncbi:acyl-CoA desaturase [Demequina sp.]|uniref:fatty acid desaturase family protein n=1 Tax=Demequina sp. TaxID=2050685 RepID=UPI0025F779F3|nr:acyl-CoA desaturase [Demequina sp.]
MSASPFAAPSLPVNHVTRTFAPLASTVRDTGLLRRSYWFYSIFGAALVLAFGGVVTGFVLLGDSWLQLLMAGALGIVWTQVAFLAHEASHRTVLNSGPANDALGRLLSTVAVGVSHQWWVSKHNRHHGNPNTMGKDPDIEKDTISFIEEDAVKAKGLVRAITKHQGWLFFPLLTLEGINLHFRSVASLIQGGTRRQKWMELPAIALHFGLYLVPLFLVLPFGMACAFLGVQLAVFGVYMGASFAPNHKGMMIIPDGVRVDFLSKQVLTSRNVSGGWTMSILMGGLNYQIEHHLFPNMARPHLGRAREIVREHCESVGLPYTETTLLGSYAEVVKYLNRVGLAARDPFDCPERVAMGR